MGHSSAALASQKKTPTRDPKPWQCGRRVDGHNLEGAQLSSAQRLQQAMLIKNLSLWPDENKQATTSECQHQELEQVPGRLG